MAVGDTKAPTTIWAKTRLELDKDIRFKDKDVKEQNRLIANKVAHAMASASNKAFTAKGDRKMTPGDIAKFDVNA